MNRTGVLRCLAAAVLFGASAPAASELAGTLPTLVLAGLLYVGAALAVAPFMMRRHRSLRALRSGGRKLALAVLFGGALGPALLVAGLVRIPAAEASLLLNFELVATTLIATIAFHAHLGGRLVTSVALVVAAGALLVWQPGATIELGGLFVIAACCCWGIDNAVTAGIDQLAPEQITFTKGAVAGTANLILGVAIAGTAGLSITSVVAALAIGALGYGASITLWVTGARDLGAARGQVIFATAPFVGAAISWTLLGEPASVAQLVALVVAAIGVALSLDTTHAHWHAHEPLEHEHEHTHDDQHHAHDHPLDHAGSVPARHTHRHRHDAVEHDHEHLPDLHHRHGH